MEETKRLPEHFVNEGLKLAKGAMIFGVPLEELSRDELLAVAAQGWKAEENAREEGAKRLKFAFDLNRARR
jgi:hypothetical protein